MRQDVLNQYLSLREEVENQANKMTDDREELVEIYDDLIEYLTDARNAIMEEIEHDEKHGR